MKFDKTSKNRYGTFTCHFGFYPKQQTLTLWTDGVCNYLSMFIPCSSEQQMSNIVSIVLSSIENNVDTTEEDIMAKL